MDWLKSEQQEKGVEIPANWLFLHYYEALSVLFKVENALRMFVYIVLKNERGKSWIDTNIASDEADQTTIGALAKKRIAQSQTYGHLGYQISSPMMHLTSGELVRLLTSDTFWPLFKPYFNAAKHVVTLKLEEIGIIRNSLAHFRPLTADDVEVVKQNANQVLPVIEGILINIVSQGQRVPTNSSEAWYLSLRSIDGLYTQVIFNQSPDGEWLTVSLQFNLPILNMYPAKPENFVSYSTLNVNPVGILNHYPEIKDRVTCVLEATPFAWIPPDFKPPISKHVKLVFSRKALETHHALLKSELERLLAQIDKEADLIREDTLARGELVYFATLQGTRTKNEKADYWYLNTQNFSYPVTGRDPVEYWGTISLFTRDFVSDADRFPWMPVAVGPRRLPF